jgi:membrane protease YdiL (CAAX protease family)
MEDALTGIQQAAAPTDVRDAVAQWRQEWEGDVAAGGAPDGDNAQLAAHRRAYGRYLVVGLDLALAFVGSQVLAAIVLFALFMATGHSLFTVGRPNLEFVTWSQTPVVLLLGLVIVDGFMVLVVWYRLSRAQLRWSTVGLGTWSLHGARERIRAGKAVLFGLAIGVVALLLSAVLGAAFQRLGFDMNGQDRLLIAPLKHAPLEVVLAMVFAGTFMAPVVEELFFRGYVFRALAVRRGVVPAYVISAATFAFFHLSGGSDLLPLTPVLFVIGLLLCFAYRRTGNLLADIAAHALNNGAAFALALLPLPFHLP